MALFDKIFSALKGDAPRDVHAQPDALQVAVGALLVEAATRDDVFDAAESAAITRLLAERFQLSSDATTQLVKAAEEAKHGSVELYGFVRKVAREMDDTQRVEVIEMLWEVVYADGVLDAHEDAMIRKIAGLLYVSDFDRGAARRRVRDKLGLTA